MDKKKYELLRDNNNRWKKLMNGGDVAVDAKGAAVKDPSLNVLDLVRAEAQRQDDLRRVESSSIREIMNLREEWTTVLRKHDDLNARMLSKGARREAKAEARRIDAIRAVDVDAVGRAATVSAQQAATLASQQSAQAETLRGQVEQTRIQLAATFGAAITPIIEGLAEVRKIQYEQAGQKAAASEPDILGPVRLELAALRQIMSEQAGARANATDNRGRSDSDRTFRLALIAAGVGLFGILVTGTLGAVGVAIAFIVH